MHTITITETPDDRAAVPTGKPVMLTVEAGDHLVFTRRGISDPERRKAALRRLIADMRTRMSDPTVETASDAIKAMRDSRG
jgi:hypothetical protein